MVDGEEVDFGDQFLVNRLGESDFVDLPDLSVSQDNPIDPLVGCIVYGLLKVLVVKGEPDCLGLD